MSDNRHRRREFIGIGAGGVAAISMGAVFWNDLFDTASSKPRRRGHGYGARGAPDELGLQIPEGFQVRRVAQGEQKVAGTGYAWHRASDGAATFPTGDGGWFYVSNSEAPVGGVSSLRFRRDGSIADAYRILDGTSQNCSGGGTPWGTWLSCEEVQDGRVWECDPTGRRKAVVHPAMGVFKHEAAAVDPEGKRVYMTEDWEGGGLYRYTPTRWHDLSEGLLEIANVGRGGRVRWIEVPDPSGRTGATRHQVKGSTRFARAEGIFRDGRVVYVSTTLDSRVHAYHIDRERIEVVYDGLALKDPPLVNVDQLTVNHAGELFVCEDNHMPSLDVGLIDRRGRVSRFVTASGKHHENSELSGICFDPSGTRMYFSSQRAGGSFAKDGPGEVYEVTGPFRRARAA
jgi:secreted PhoX family phosphatase